MNIFNKYTLKTLAKNKTRTLVTIIGIILSAAMICAVTSLVTSLQSFLLNQAISREGDWHGVVLNISSDELSKLQGNDKLLNYATLQNIGYSVLEEGENNEKPYLAVLGIDSSFKEMMPIHLTKGRMPETTSEIILPKHLQTNGGVKYQLGDVLELTLGERISNDTKVYQDTAFQYGKYGSEEFIPTNNRTYQVVGFYERPSFESYSAPGYSALTLIDETASDSYLAYIKMSNPKEVFQFIIENFSAYDANYNYDVLRYIGASNETSFNAVLYGLSSILIGIIMVASISLIYNAFSISISERIKQFGLLASIGATKRQLMKSVMFEASFLSIIGIPLGILSGLTGIGITLHFTKNLIVNYLVGNTDSSLTLNLKITPISILITALIAYVTILISAYIPARKAVKISNIEAIRQNHDIYMKSKSVKTSKLAYKLFGFEGMIASKNFKRNKRKYRATVFSLFVSVVLFITASSYCAYLKQSSNAIVSPPSYDIAYFYDSDTNKNESLQDLYNLLASTNGVTKSNYASHFYSDILIDSKKLTKEYVDFYKNIYGTEYYNFDQEMETTAVISFINDEEYEKYLTENGFDKNKYMNLDNPVGIAVDFIKRYANDKYYTFHLLNDSNLSIDLLKRKEIDGYYFSEQQTNASGETIYIYEKESKDSNVVVEGEDTYYSQNDTDASSKDSLAFTEDEVISRIQLNIGETTDALPLGLERNEGELIIMYPYSAMSSVLGDDTIATNEVFFFQTSDHKKVYDSMYKELDEQGIPTHRLIDVAESADTDRAILTIINVFSYGFITLISLIATANVFNTISTNIHLRRREFAMLKSIGMTQKGFHKMMNYECMLYGFKGLLYGLPVSFIIIYFIYRAMLNGWETSFFIPINSIIIVIVSVFIVVFSTMLYSTSLIKKDNTIDALKNENI